MTDFSTPDWQELITEAWLETKAWEAPVVWVSGGASRVLLDWLMAPSIAGAVDATCLAAKTLDQAEASVRVWLEALVAAGGPVSRIQKE